jgi:IS5 family transposase
VFYGIVRRRKRGQKELPEHDVKMNATIAKVRAIVEHPFAWMRQMGFRRTRYRGRARNEFDFAMTLIAYNFKRVLSLSPT